MSEKDKLKKKLFKEAGKEKREKFDEQKISVKKENQESLPQPGEEVIDGKEKIDIAVQQEQFQKVKKTQKAQPREVQQLKEVVKPTPKTKILTPPKFFSIFPYGKIINFMKFRRWAYAISSALALFSLFVILSGRVPLSPDFRGGVSAEVEYRGDKKISEGELRALFPEATIQKLGEREFLLKLPLDFVEKAKQEGKDAGSVIKEKLDQIGQFETKRVESVGSLIGTELRKKGVLAVIFSLIGISIYILLRFEWRFAVGAFISLFHDSIITLGIASALGVEFSLPTLAAILTLIGYSINDSIIIADRIREKLRLSRAVWTEELFNKAISETLSRTIITVFTVMLPTITIILFGTGVLKDIGIFFLIGLIFGTYSSIFVVSAMALDIYNLTRKKRT
jgi:preprotein translocase subunit SecF